MKQRREAAGPVGVTEVHGIDPVLGQLRRPPLGTFLHLGQPRGVDQLHVGMERAEAGDGLPVRMAEPEAGEQVGRGLPHRLDHRSGRRDVLEVEGEVVVAAAVSRRSARVGMWAGSWDGAGAELGRGSGGRYAVVVEHRHAVGGQPDVALQAVAPRRSASGTTPGCSPVRAPGLPGGRRRSARRGATGGVAARPPLWQNTAPAPETDRTRRLGRVFTLSGARSSSC